ncbi:phytase [Motilibacter aurantiacus]|uniref:phytase n=1 Tax=Motilibacter aurantiacus TaxID=2714955 RepID=UPI00140C1F48|nr:phytase [Motilibacter aurantiacus]NHC44157.1 phytase [Motilibacter aurantiacus]
MLRWTAVRRVLAVSALPGLAVLGVPGTGSAASDKLALHPVTARAETASSFDDAAGGDADADDPAIWVSPTEPAQSVVLGTLKNGGLTVFDLAGRTLQHVSTPPAPGEGLEAGRFNNVDILQRVAWGNGTADIAVVTDRGRDRLRFYLIDPRGSAAGDAVLRDVTAPDVPRLFSATEADVEGQRTGYGLALRAAPGGGLPYAVVSRRHETRIGLFALRAVGGLLTYAPAASVDLPARFAVAGGTWSPCQDPGERPQVEGMVVDGETDTLYAAQEDVGVWRVPLSASGFGKPKLVEKTRSFGLEAEFDEETEECVPTGGGTPAAGAVLEADAEGLTIARSAGGRDLLLASSQGDSTFAVFALRHASPRLVGRVEVTDGTVDGVQHSDGAAVTTTPLGPAFPNGMLVVHDGENTPRTVDAEGDERTDTNFKLVDWQDVQMTLR